MAEFPTVGLKVDLSGIDAGGTAYDELRGKIAGVGVEADAVAKKVQASATTTKAAAETSVKSAETTSAATTKAARAAAAADAEAARIRTQARRNLEQMEIAAIQAEEAARRAAHAEIVRLATDQSRAIIEADRAATAQQVQNADYLLKVRLNSFRMQETAAQKTALAQIKADNEASAAAAAAAARRAAIAATPVPVVITPGAPSSTAQMAEQILATEAAYLAQAKAINTVTEARAALSDETKVATAVTASQATGMDKIAVAYAAATKLSLDEARAVLNTTSAYKGMFPPLNATSVATEEYAIRADRLRASLIPAAAAQQLLAKRTQEAGELLKANAITQAEHTTLMAAATKAYHESTNAVTGTSLKVREFLVILREASRGDVTRLAGSLSILAGAFGLLTATIVANAAIIAAAVAPFVLFFAAMALGSSEAAKLNNAITVTNGAIGESVGQITQSAEAIGKSMDYSQGKVIALMTHLVSTGKVTSDSISLVAENSIKLSQLTGEAADKIADKLLSAFDDAAKGAFELNQQYHFLTLAQYEQIEALEKAGDKQGAFTLAMKDLHDSLSTATVDMGFFEGAIHRVAEAFDGVIQKVKDFGKTAPPEIRLAQAQARLAADQNPLAFEQSSPDVKAAIAKDKADIALFTKEATAAWVGAAKKADEDATQAAGITAHRYLDSVDKSLGGSKEMLKQAISDYKAQVAAALRADPKDAKALDDQEHMATRIAALAKKFDRADTVHTKADPVQERLQALRAEAQGNTIVADTLDLTTAAGVRAVAMQKALADAAKTTRAGTNLNTTAQKFFGAELDVVTTAAAKQAEIEAATTNVKSKAIEQATSLVETLGVSQATANQMVADSNELAKLQADYDAASIRRKPLLAKAIADTAAAQERRNTADARAFIVNQRQSDADQMAVLTEESKLIGANNAVRAVAIAQLREEQDLRLHHVTPTNPDGTENVDYTKAIRDAKTLAGGQNDLRSAQDAYNESLGHTLTMLQLIAEHTATLGQGLAAAFGKPGQAIAALANASATLAVQQETINKKRTADLKALAITETATAEERATVAKRTAEIQQESDAALTGAQLTHDAAVLQSFMGLFGQKTAAYKVLQTIQQVYYAEQFAMQAKALALDVISTVKWIANSGARAAANGIEAVAKAMASLPFPLNLAAAAATAAALVAFGVAISGGGGNSSAGVNDAADRQKAQGSGSVLGDAAAKSNSIAKSLEIVAANTNKNLEFSNGMLTALRSIDANISSLTDLLARQLQAGIGAFDTSSLHLGTTNQGPGLLQKIFNPIAAILPGLFGSKTTNTLQDQGLQFNPTTVGQAAAGGLSGNTYAQVQSETQKKFFGITISDKTHVNTTTGALDSDVQNQITAVIASLRSGVLAAAGALGVTGAQAVLDAMTVDLGKISFKDMTGPQIQDALNAVFGKLADNMATTALPMIAELQKVGEGAFQTLTRVARDYQVLDVTLSELGLTFGAVGVSSLKAREHLIDLAGGLDNLTSQVSDYASKFLTPEQQITPVIKAVYTELGRLGFGAITTKAQFVALVNSLDLTTDAGAQTFATLMNIAPAFAQITDYMAGLATANDAVTSAQTALNDAYNSAADVIQATHDKFQGFVDTLTAFRKGLETGPAAALSPQDQYLKTKAIFEDTAAKAAGGDQKALGDLTSVSQDYLDASKAYYASTEPYFQDLAAVKAATDASITYAQNQVSAADQQLSALNKMVDGLITVNSSVLSVADAIKALQAAEAAQAALVAAAQAAVQAAATQAANQNTPPATTAPPAPALQVPVGASQIDYNQLLRDRPDVLAQYNNLIAIADKNSPWFAQHGLDKGAVGFAQWWYTQGGGSSSYTQYMAAAQTLDTSSQVIPSDVGSGSSGVVLPAAPTATASAPAAASGAQSVADALAALTKEVKVGNVLAQSGFQATVSGLTDLRDSTDDVAKQVRLQAA